MHALALIYDLQTIRITSELVPYKFSPFPPYLVNQNMLGRGQPLRFNQHSG